MFILVVHTALSYSLTTSTKAKDALHVIKYFCCIYILFQMSGFSVEVTNNQHKNTVMVGVRVLLGSRSLDRAPSTIECFGRMIQVSVWLLYATCHV